VTTQPHGVGNALQSARLAVHARVLIKKNPSTASVFVISTQLGASAALLTRLCLPHWSMPRLPKPEGDRSCPESGKSGVSYIITLPLFLVSFVGRKISLFSFLICRQPALVNEREVMAFFSKCGDSGMNSNPLRTQAPDTFSFRGLIMTQYRPFSSKIRKLRAPSNTQLRKSSY
jgi:hypothetical protein